MIKVKNLHKKFDELEVLKGIDEHIRPGEVVVVIGPSGSGKSTFLRCLNQLETATEGEIYVDDELITDPKCDVNKVRQKNGNGIFSSLICSHTLRFWRILRLRRLC